MRRKGSITAELITVAALVGVGGAVVLPGRQYIGEFASSNAPFVFVGGLSSLFSIAACLSCPAMRRHPLLVLSLAAVVYAASMFAGFVIIYHFQWAVSFVLLCAGVAFAYFVVASNRRSEQ